MVFSVTFTDSFAGSFNSMTPFQESSAICAEGLKPAAAIPEYLRYQDATFESRVFSATHRGRTESDLSEFCDSAVLREYGGDCLDEPMLDLICDSPSAWSATTTDSPSSYSQQGRVFPTDPSGCAEISMEIDECVVTRSSYSSSRTSVSFQDNEEPVCNLPLGECGRSKLKSLISNAVRSSTVLKERCDSVGKIKTATVSQLFELARVCGLMGAAKQLSDEFLEHKKLKRSGAGFSPVFSYSM